MSQAVRHDSRIPGYSEWSLAFVISSVVACFVWRGLLFGGGLVGGDTYPYYLPQKQVLAEAFSRGEIPLWHDRTSLGYPLHAESQAGVFYPATQLLYRVLDVHTAYHVNLLVHYVLAGILAWRFCRCQGLSASSSQLAALVYVYGWFPVRVSLEWSIIGGVWLPLCLWMSERLLQKPSLRRFACLACCMGVHLLAGHYTLAFVTQLTCLMFAFFSSPFQRRNSGLRKDANVDVRAAMISGKESVWDRDCWRASGLIALSIAVAMLLGAVQLIPSLELKQQSQRDGQHSVFNPADGHMPPMYLTQLVASWWYWHTPEVALSRETLKHPFLISSGDTNPVEAHLYLGLIPFFLLTSLLSSRVRFTLRATPWKLWLGLSLAAVVYAFGWLVPLTRHLPGFGFFIGPGRYTIVTTLGLAIVAGLALDALLRRRRVWFQAVLTVIISVVTLADVLKSAEYPVSNAQVVARPPMYALKDSWLAKVLQEEDRKSPVRILAGGPNVGNLFGVSSVPQYLGLGPSEYFSEATRLQTQPQSAEDVFPSEEQLRRLQSLAVTHLLMTEPLEKPAAECRLEGSAPDAFLNRVWGRGGADCWLYRIENPVGRVSTNPASALSSVRYQLRNSGDVRFNVTLSADAEICLNDLMFPGWMATVNNAPAQPVTESGFGRRLKLKAGEYSIRWFYGPPSFSLGAMISVVTAAGLVLAAVWRRRTG